MDRIDLGDGHVLTFMRWAPADTPFNRKLFGIPIGQPMPVVERFGATIEHLRPDGQPCVCTVHFTGDWQRVCAKTSDPGTSEATCQADLTSLTFDQPVLCQAPILDGHGKKVGVCGDHGYVKDGKWVRA